MRHTNPHLVVVRQMQSRGSEERERQSNYIVDAGRPQAPIAGTNSLLVSQAMGTRKQ